MTPTVTLIAAGAHEKSAVGSRVGCFRRGLVRKGWRVVLVDSRLPHSTPMERLLDHAPTRIRLALESGGIEGDIRPALGWRARHALRAVRADVAVVSVPPFSLLGAAAAALDETVPLVVDYRDPWSARHNPPPLARATRAVERLAVRRAAAVVYAGSNTLGELLVRHLALPTRLVVSVPNGIDPNDLVGLRPIQSRRHRNGQPLELVMNGYWYGRNGPGILLDALERVGHTTAQLTIIGDVSASIAAALKAATGRPLVRYSPVARHRLYRRLQEADAAVVTVDRTTAWESRIPAKIYDYLATGVPVIAVCPHDAALLQLPGAQRFHHVHHRDVQGLVALLSRAARDRATLRTGGLADGPSRELGVDALHATLLGAINQ